MYSRSYSVEKYKTQTKDTKKRKQSYRTTQWRWFGLCMACFVLFGDSYCFDNPMALQSAFEKTLNIDELKFNFLYSVYSLPNIILPFFGGMLMDKIGLRAGLFIFSIILIIGQAVFTFGGFSSSFWIMLVGRGIFGIGSESLTASQSAIMSNWYIGKELSLALGLCLATPKLGSALNSAISPQVYAISNNLGYPLLVGVGVCLFSFICALVLIFMDQESDQREKQIEKSKIEQQLLEDGQYQDLGVSQEISMLEESKNNEQEEKQQQQQQNKHHTSNLFSSDAPRPIGLKDQEQNDDQQQEGQEAHHEGAGQEINIKDLKRLSASFWILLLICSLTEALFVPFLDNGNSFFVYRFAMTPEQAGTLLVFPYLISTILTPILGIYIDRMGKRGLMIIGSCVIYLITHILLMNLSCSEKCLISYVPVIMLGLCYSLYSVVIIPSIPIVVPPKIIGTAFGLAGVFQNTALTIFPLVTASIYGSFYHEFLEDGDGQHDASQQAYFYQAEFFVGMCILCLFVSIALYIYDQRSGKLFERGLPAEQEEEEDILDHIAEENIKRRRKSQKRVIQMPQIVEYEVEEDQSPTVQRRQQIFGPEIKQEGSLVQNSLAGNDQSPVKNILKLNSNFQSIQSEEYTNIVPVGNKGTQGD